ncbi:MAG: ABC transporter substrate-binding protein [Dehalococcoidia bacterium]|nr:ABC transporter substrate-binding protein [Dehalococcoidia bacterium]
MPKQPEVMSLDPQYLGDILEDIRRIGRSTGAEEAATSITARLQERIDAVGERAAQATSKPKVLHLEWVDPLLCGGHWVPEMVELAGGINCFGDKETGSFRIEWPDIVASQPDVIVFMPCGFEVKRGLEDVPTVKALEGGNSLPAGQDNRVYVVDASAYTSRSGPRLVTGLEIMAEILHPELFSGLIPEAGAARLYGNITAD